MSYRYRLYRDNRERETARYTMDELQNMGTFMLRDICAKEKIMTHSAGIDPKRLDREALIRLLFRYRGRHEEELKDDFLEESVEILETLAGRAAAASEKLEVPYKIELKRDIPLPEEEGILISHGFEGNHFLGALSDGEGKIQAVFELNKERFSLSPRRVAKSLAAGQYKNYQVILFDAPSSLGAIRAYNGQVCDPATERNMVAAFARLPLLTVVEAEESEEPLVIDFGAGNTAASSQGSGQILEVRFWKNSCLCPSVAAVERCKEGGVSFRFGYEALDLIRQDGYENSISFYHNLKLYLCEEKTLDLCDREGNAMSLSSDLLLEQFFRYVISRAKGEHGRNYRKLRFLLPEKRSCLALRRLRKLLPDYEVESAQSESVNSVYEKLAKELTDQSPEEPVRELAFHCGGGSASLVACTYSVENTSVSYKVRLREQYLNGDSSFGGDHLTHLIFMYLKVREAEELRGVREPLLQGGLSEIYSAVDQCGGTGELYGRLRELYEEAERLIPTRFSQFDENRFLKRQNFFRLWFLAENLKIAFFSGEPVSLIRLPDRFAGYCAVNVISREGMREQRIDFAVHREEMELLLAPEIYRLVKSFIEPLCDEYGILSGYRIRFTGMSCQIPVFRDAMREFTVGRRARTGKGSPSDLKLRALKGAVLREQMKKSGRLIPEITREEARTAYIVTVETHEGETVRIISEGRRDGDVFGYVGRHTATREVEFTVCDVFGNPVGTRRTALDIARFQETGYEELFDSFPFLGEVQGDIDSIGEEEIRLFVFREESWDFSILPVARQQGVLRVDGVRRFLYDSESVDYFSGEL